MIKQDDLTSNFKLNSTPIIWMRREREILIKNLPSKDSFIIINPEEIGKKN